jgi:hypothetical protein
LRRFAAIQKNRAPTDKYGFLQEIKYMDFTKSFLWTFIWKKRAKTRHNTPPNINA